MPRTINLKLTTRQYYHTLALFEGYLNGLKEDHDLADPENDWLALDWQRYRDIYDELLTQEDNND